MAGLEAEHREVDGGAEVFAGGPQATERDKVPLQRAISALRRHTYLREVFLFPRLRAAGLVAPVFVMLRENAQMWQVLDSLERELGADRVDGAGSPGSLTGNCKPRAIT